MLLKSVYYAISICELMFTFYYSRTNRCWMKNKICFVTVDQISGLIGEQ